MALQKQEAEAARLQRAKELEDNLQRQKQQSDAFNNLAKQKSQLQHDEMVGRLGGLYQQVRFEQRRLAHSVLLSVSGMRSDAGIKVGQFAWARGMPHNAGIQIATYAPLLKAQRGNQEELFDGITKLVDIGHTQYPSAQKLSQALYAHVRQCFPDCKYDQLRPHTRKIPYDSIRIYMTAVERLLVELSKTDGLTNSAARLKFAQSFQRERIGDAIVRHDALRRELLDFRATQHIVS